MALHTVDIFIYLVKVAWKRQLLLMRLRLLPQILSVLLICSQFLVCTVKYFSIYLFNNILKKTQLPASLGAKYYAQTTTQVKVKLMAVVQTIRQERPRLLYDHIVVSPSFAQCLRQPLTVLTVSRPKLQKLRSLGDTF